MATVQSVHNLISEYHQEFALLHCVSAYPTAPENVNLRVIDLYQRKFPDIPIGYSGHERGIGISIAAVARGAKVSTLVIHHAISPCKNK